MGNKNSMSLFRKRYIPCEVNHLKDDKILYADDKMIITSWNALKPRSDIKRGVSAYYLDKGYKVSKLYDSDDNIVYWYCDIINSVINKQENSIVFEDLLLDVIVYEDGRVVVMDADELAQAIEKHMIPIEYACIALNNMNELLKVIYSGNFCEITEFIDRAEEKYE